MNKGKFLEFFVSSIEKIFSPENISVETNEKIFNDAGVQIVEFDIIVKGTIGTTYLTWLIECRDRPSKGAAPAAWIEQLVGRKNRFKFNHVIAVSTTGYAPDAIKYAQEAGVEIRTVTDSNLEQIKDWCLIEEMTIYRKGGLLTGIFFIIEKNDTVEVRSALKSKLENHSPEQPLLFSTETKEFVTAAAAFDAAIHSIPEVNYHLIKQGDGEREVEIRAIYPKEESCYLIKTTNGDVRVNKIVFTGKIWCYKELYPINVIKYKNLSYDKDILTTAYCTFKINENYIEIALNKEEKNGAIHVTVAASR